MNNKKSTFQRCPYNKGHIVNIKYFLRHIEQCRRRKRPYLKKKKFFKCVCDIFVQIHSLKHHHIRCREYQDYIKNNSQVQPLIQQHQQQPQQPREVEEPPPPEQGNREMDERERLLMIMDWLGNVIAPEEDNNEEDEGYYGEIFLDSDSDEESDDSGHQPPPAAAIAV